MLSHDDVSLRLWEVAGDVLPVPSKTEQKMMPKPFLGKARSPTRFVLDFPFFPFFFGIVDEWRGCSPPANISHKILLLLP